MNISSSAFGPGEIIPDIYTCNGDNISPPLTFTNIPSDTRSLALVVDDPDAPAGTFTHWLVWNIPPATTQIDQGKTPAGAVVGSNSFGKTSYSGPCPPSGTHHYYFRVYALDIDLDLPAGSAKSDFLKQIAGHVLSKGELIGLYGK